MNKVEKTGEGKEGEAFCPSGKGREEERKEGKGDWQWKRKRDEEFLPAA